MEDFDYPGVYGLSVDGEILYVGSSRNIKSRLGAHFSLLRRNAHKEELQTAFNNGKDVVPVCLKRLSEQDSIGTLYANEMYWIDELSPVCTDRKPLSESPEQYIEFCAGSAMEKRFMAEHPENDYMKMHHENAENWYYASILAHAERYFTPMKNEGKQLDLSMYDSVIIRFGHDERLAVNKAARSHSISTEKFIKNAVREYMANH